MIAMITNSLTPMGKISTTEILNFYITNDFHLKTTQEKICVTASANLFKSKML